MKLPVRKCFGRIGPDQRGATAVEYGLIISLLVIAAVTSISYLGNSSSGMWNHIANEFPAG